MRDDPRPRLTRARSELALNSDELWYHGDEQTIGLRMQLDDCAARPDTVAVAVFMANATRNGMTFPPPEVAEVDTDGCVALELNVCVPDGARMHQEYLRGLVVAEGTLSFVTRPVWVRPQRRHLMQPRYSG